MAMSRSRTFANGMFFNSGVFSSRKPSETATLPANEADPSEQMLMSQEARQLAICLERLEANQRQAVALAYLRDQSHSEVADILKVPLGTVKSWIRRGLEKLKTCLGGL